MANLSNINNKLIVTDEGNLLVNSTTNLATYGGITIDNFSDPSIAMKTTSASGWLWTQYITNTGTNNFSMGVNQTQPYWCVKAGAGMDSPHLAVNSLGNVGIGITSPSFKLGLSDSTALTAVYQQFTNGTTGVTSSDGTVMGIDADGDFLINNQESKVIKLFTSDTEAVRIDTDQNVRTYAKLGIRVDGDAIPWRGTAQIPAVINLAGNGALFTRPDNTFLSQNFYYNTSDVGAVVDAGQASIIQLTAGEIIFSGSTTGASSGATISVQERMRIDSSGKVGIGTTPTEMLHIKGGGSGPEIRLEGTWGSHYIRAYNDNWNFLVGGTTQAITIKNNGNVGIGQTAPDQNLVIGNYLSAAQGTMRLTALGGQPTAGTIRNSLELSLSSEFSVNNGDAYKFSLGLNSAVGNQGSYNSDFVIRRTTRLGVTDNVDLMIDGTSGNVGIGTTSPGAKLDVNGSLAIANTGQINLTRTLNTNNLWYGMRYDNNEVQIYTYYASDRSITFNTVSGGTGITSQLMKIEAGGNVGIGTTSPDQIFVVNQTTTGRYVFKGEYNGTNLGGLFVDGSENAELFLKADGNVTKVKIDTAGDSYFNGGNVGIGTDSPPDKLYVDAGTAAKYAGQFVYGGTDGTKGCLKLRTVASTGPSFIDFFYDGFNLKPKTFNYKNVPDVEVQGFLAHELQEVIPQAVHGEKDETHPDGNPKYQLVDHSHMIPLLTAAIKELKAENDSLKARIETLENN